jgi:predicted peptidase
MPGKKVSPFFIITLFGLLLPAFQNCSPFAGKPSALVASSEGAAADPAIIPPLDAAVPVVSTPATVNPAGPINPWEPPPVANATPGTFTTADFTCDYYGAARDMPYRILLPAQYDPVNYRYPVVADLGDSGVDVMSDNDRFISDIGSIWNVASTRQNYPAIVVAPQAGYGDDWGQSAASPSGSSICGRQIMHMIVTTYAADTKRVYVTGGWMGGSGSWDWISREPGFFTAALPQGGAVADSAFAPALINSPVWAFYGNFVYGGGHKEKVQALVDAIHSLGGTKVKFTDNPLGDPAGMYGPWNINPLRPGVLDWLFSQRHP